MRAEREDGMTIEVLADGTWRPVAAEARSRPNSADAGFRGVPWGSAPAHATQREGREQLAGDGDGQLFWADVAMAGLQWSVVYDFLDSRLSSGAYLLSTRWDNEDRYVTEFERLRSLLTTKYGPPISDQEDWGRNEPEGPERFGMAVCTGHLTLRAFWETDESQIVLFLHGENFDSFLGLKYTSTQRAVALADRDAAAYLADL